METPEYWTSPGVLMTSPTLTMVSPQCTHDKWVLDTVLGAKIELEDISDLPIHVNSKQPRNNMSDFEKCLFRKEIARLRDRGVIKPIKNLEGGFISSVFLREKKDKQHRLTLNLKKFNKFVAYRHFKMDTLYGTKYGSGKLFHVLN